MPPAESQRFRRLGDNEADARRRLLRAAEVCVQRHGINKVTMEDIAREARISRPSIYRYFDDREDLLIQLTAEHSRALILKTHRLLAKQSSFEDAIVEGLLYLADHGQRDEFTRHLVNANNDSAFSQRLAASHTNETLTSEFWGEFLSGAQLRGEMDPELDLDDVHYWLAHTGLMLMSLISNAPGERDRLRRLTRRFVVSGLLPSRAAQHR